MPGIYILKDPATNYFKIGRANNFQTRLRNLRVGNPRLLEARWIETAFGSKVETYLHNRLCLYRREGEYFEVAMEIVEAEIDHVLSLIASRPNEDRIQQVSLIENIVHSRDAHADEVSTVREILEIRAQKEKLEFEEGVLLDKLKVSIGEHAGLKNWATFQSVSRQSLDLEALRRDKPEIFDQYSKKTTSRTLRIRPFIRQNDGV
jgi:hypothetical protein